MSETSRHNTTMKKYLLAACAMLALASSASAMDSEKDWVLLELYWANGAGAKPVTDRLVLPEFPTRAACQAALRSELQRHAGLSHAEGGGNYYLCSHLSDWSVSM
jgi:hypothetical protein